MDSVRDRSASSGNVFADLDLPEPEELLAKAQLVRAIDRAVSERGWTEARAAAALGMDEPRLSALLRGHFDDIPLDQLLRCLRDLGHDVEIVIVPRDPARPNPTLAVRFGAPGADRAA